MKNKLTIFFLLAIGSIVLLTPTVGYSKTFSSILIENPTPTCEEKVYSELKFVNEIEEDIDDDFFLAVPYTVAADDDGNVYVFDKKQFKVLRYDKNLKFVAQYGTRGSGPGEFGGKFAGIFFFYIAIGYDNNLYVSDRMNKTVHCLTPAMELKKDIKIKLTGNFPFFVPTPEKNGNFYATLPYSEEKNGIIQFNSKGELKKSFMDKSLLKYQLYYEVCPTVREAAFDLSPSWLSMDVAKGNLLLVYYTKSGFFQIFEDGRLKKKLKLWPKKALEFYKSDLKSILPEKGAFYPFFIDLIVDRDDENYFYLRYPKPDKKNRTYLYKYDLEGNLKKVLYLEDKPKSRITQVKYKRNNLFYAIGQNKSQEITIKTYKEKKQ